MQSMPALLVVLVIAVVASVVGLHLVRLRVPHEVRKTNNEVAGFFLAVLGVMYAVLLAFVVVAAWEDFKDTTRTVEQEANELVDVYRVSQALPAPIGTDIRALPRSTRGSRIEVEWPAMARGVRTEEQALVLEKIWRTVTESQGAEAQDDVLRAQFFQHFSALSDARQSRLAGSRGEPALGHVGASQSGRRRDGRVHLFLQRAEPRRSVHHDRPLRSLDRHPARVLSASWISRYAAI